MMRDICRFGDFYYTTTRRFAQDVRSEVHRGAGFFL